MYSHGSFNRVYRLVWSALHQTWVVASELAGGRGKSSSTPLLSAALLAGLAGLSGGAGAAPQGGQVVGGSGSISTSGATTTITQASDKLSLNWQSFNVGKTESVNFVQPSASAVAANRIYDTQGSQILGRINANGQVWLINPNGVLFGKDAQINVGGLLASTLNPDDASIGSTRSNFSGSSTAGVVNFGQINAAQGGYVALLGHSVSNQGSISAPGGTVALGAGSAVSLNFAGSKLLGLEVTGNQVNALAENGGLIQADGGQVLLSAGARNSLLPSVVNNTGVIQARTVQEQDGKIILLGGMAAGTTNVKGTLDASAPNGGNGGFIETSAYTVKVDDSASITTASAQGTQGQWLIDPFDFYVKASGGNITGAALGTALGNNNVTIQTVAAANPTVTGATASGSYPSGLGDIYVNDAVAWSANYTLTLHAHNSIYINSPITATGASGKLALEYSQGTGTGSYSVNAPVSLQAAVATGTSGNFSTKLAGTATTYYTVITSLGSAGDQSLLSATNSLQGLGYSTRLSGNYVLGADIAASGTSTWNSNSGFSPIGDATTNFTGTFDGLGHTITGLTISRSATDFVGLMGNLSSAASIRNIGLVGGSVTGASYVGNLVGAMSGSATVSGSYATGSVSGTTNYAGGLVGILSLGTISNSYATGAVSGAARQMGGLVGNFTAGTIISSYATGAVNGASIAGGLVGNQSAAGTISASYATGAVSGGAYGGGLVGYSTGTISSSYATGTASGTGLAGGLVAYQVEGSIASSYATGAVSASGSASTGWAGGLVASNGGTITNSYATGAVSAPRTPVVWLASVTARFPAATPPVLSAAPALRALWEG
jgi:filamentous hemagglutinin family protein